MTAIVTPLTGFPRQPYIVLASMVSPGIATIKDLDMPRDWKEFPPYGCSGASLVYAGQGLSTFKVEIQLWLPEHFIAWNLFSTILAPPIKGAASMALGIKHPIVNGPPQGIKDVVVTNCSDPVQNDLGRWVYTISFKQFRPPQQALARPIASIPVVGTPQPTAQDAAETSMLALSAQAKALGGF